MTLSGKGFFTFILPDCEKGNPAEIASVASSAGLSHVIVKIADGTDPFGIDKSGDHTLRVVQALRAAGIAVWGWHSVYGIDPVREADVAIRRVVELGLKGYVINAEEEYIGRQQAAVIFMTELRNGLLSFPVALSSFRFPNSYPEFPWDEFLEKCDYHMPQVYWEKAHNAAGQLRESKTQCDSLAFARPYIATGPAYAVPGWAPSPEEILEFFNAASELGIQAVNFYSWDFCRRLLPALWISIAEFNWAAPAPDSTRSAPAPIPVLPFNQPDATLTAYLNALNARQIPELMNLYAPGASLVRGGKNMRGLAAIQADFIIRLGQLPPGLNYQLQQFEIDGETRHLHLICGASSYRETLVVKEGKITSHYIFEI